MNKKILKLLAFVALLVFLVIAVTSFPDSTRIGDMLEEHAPSGKSHILNLETMPDKLCFGLPVVAEEQLQKIKETGEAELSKLYYNGQKAPVDISGGRVYISQTHSDISNCGQLRGEFTYDDGQYALCFVESGALNNVSDSLINGDPLTMVIVGENGYSRVSVVLTSLPVIRMDGSFQKYGEILGKEIMAGSFSLWTSDENVSSLIQWHYRGFGAMDREKKAYKLSLKTDREQTRHCDLLGLGADDDWILNPMSVDDLKLREKMAMSLWNEGFAGENWNYHMSTGEYVELVCNDEYWGLYYLQRRLDEKYLQTDPETDIVFKGRIGVNLQQYVYEPKYSPYNENTSFVYMNRLLNDLGSDNNVNLENFVDVTLFLNYLAAEDNITVTNMYYILRQAADAPQLFMVPWDTDISWGILLFEVFDYADAGARLFIRDEYEVLKDKFPELDDMMRKRWFELRKSVFSEENILREIEENSENIPSWNAAMQRDDTRWGLFHYGADSVEQFTSFCLNRLQFLDEYYNSL